MYATKILGQYDPIFLNGSHFSIFLYSIARIIWPFLIHTSRIIHKSSQAQLITIDSLC